MNSLHAGSIFPFASVPSKKLREKRVHCTCTFFHDPTMQPFIDGKIRLARLHLSVLTTNDKVFNIYIYYTLQNEILISSVGLTHVRTPEHRLLDFFRFCLTSVVNCCFVPTHRNFTTTAVIKLDRWWFFFTYEARSNNIFSVYGSLLNRCKNMKKGINLAKLKQVKIWENNFFVMSNCVCLRILNTDAQWCSTAGTNNLLSSLLSRCWPGRSFAVYQPKRRTKKKRFSPVQCFIEIPAAMI